MAVRRMGWCADIFAEPVVHFIDFVDQDEPWLRKVIGGRHNHVPQALGFDDFADLVCNQTFIVSDIATTYREICRTEFESPGRCRLLPAL